MTPTLWYHSVSGRVRFDGAGLGRNWVPLYAAPRQWVGLTDADLETLFPAIATYHEANKTLYRSIARAIESKLKELNT